MSYENWILSPPWEFYSVMHLIPPLENYIGFITHQFAHHNHSYTTLFGSYLYSFLEREKEEEMENHWVLFERSWILTVVIFGMIGTTILINNFNQMSNNSLLCSISGTYTRPDHSDDSVAQTQLIAILHYTTSKVILQQSLAEIKVSFDVLQSLTPCNFWVYGLGHDSIIWSFFNLRGIALFLEEDHK